METEWEVEYSRFFSSPRFRRSSSLSLRQPPKCKTRASCGIWLSSDSPASLLLLSPSAILSLSVLAKIYEEHFVSNLHFSWPQVSFETDCSVRGSKALLASSVDSEAQTQKFALTFSKGSDVQVFLNAVKETIVKAQFNFKFGRSNFEGEIFSQSEYIASSTFYHRIDEPSGFVGINDGDQSEIPIVEVEECKPEGSQYPSLDNDLANDFSALPSFTELLTGCMRGDVTKDPPDVPEGIDPISQASSYVSNSSSQEFCERVDWIINQLGGEGDT